MEPQSPPSRGVGNGGDSDTGDKRANVSKHPKVGGDEGVFLPWLPTKKEGGGDEAGNGGTDGEAVDIASLTSDAGGSGGGGSGAAEIYSVVPAGSG